MKHNAGMLRERVQLLTLSEQPDGCTWQKTAAFRAAVSYPKGSNLFSKVGIGVRSVQLKLRRRDDLTLHHAMLLDGQHLFLTKIDLDADRLYQTVEAAAITPVLCAVSRKEVTTDARHNRPTLTQTKVYTFPACMTEKYLKFDSLTPQDVTETTYVLVTPKAVTLRAGEVVTIGEDAFCVQIGHTLDPYKNEYEVMRKEDA